MEEKMKIKKKGRISEFSARGVWISPADLSTSIYVWKRRFGPYVVNVRLLHLDHQRQWKILILFLSQFSSQLFQFSEKTLSS